MKVLSNETDERQYLSQPNTRIPDEANELLSSLSAECRQDNGLTDPNALFLISSPLKQKDQHVSYNAAIDSEKKYTNCFDVNEISSISSIPIPSTKQKVKSGLSKNFSAKKDGTLLQSNTDCENKHNEKIRNSTKVKSYFPFSKETHENKDDSHPSKKPTGAHNASSNLKLELIVLKDNASNRDKEVAQPSTQYLFKSVLKHTNPQSRPNAAIEYEKTLASCADCSENKQSISEPDPLVKQTVKSGSSKQSDYRLKKVLQSKEGESFNKEKAIKGKIWLSTLEAKPKTIGLKKLNKKQQKVTNFFFKSRNGKATETKSRYFS